MDPSSLMAPFGVNVDLIEGIMDRCDRHIIRKASVMRGYYADEAALERLITDSNDPLHYETFEKDVPEKFGQLAMCISKLSAISEKICCSCFELTNESSFGKPRGGQPGPAGSVSNNRSFVAGWLWSISSDCGIVAASSESFTEFFGDVVDSIV